VRLPIRKARRSIGLIVAYRRECRTSRFASTESQAAAE
jgi:hypothetical protein